MKNSLVDDSVDSPLQTWMLISLFNFFIAISAGALLRFAFVQEISWLEFRNFLHAHSHVAMLGWVYLALFIFLIKSFLNPTQQKSSIYKILFWSTQLSVWGMLISFPIVGYSALSIFFSSLHVVFSYVFVWRFLKDLKSNSEASTTSIKFIKTALFFMVLSTLALWGMAPIIILELKGSGLYHMAIQFYLHFQFNGWFIFAVLGLFFKFLETHEIKINVTHEKLFYGLLLVSCFLTYALAVTWANPEDYIFWINSLGVALQFIAIIYFIKIILSIKSQLISLSNSWTLTLFRFSFFCFLIKVVIQTAVLIPYIATVAYTVRNFAMGFLHLMLLGMITCFILAFGNQEKMVSVLSKTSKTGLIIFLSGFILSEGLLFFQGLLLWQAIGFIPFYYETIFVFSLLMPLGIGVFLIAQFKEKRVGIKTNILN
jgi:hypothetical protein